MSVFGLWKASLGKLLQLCTRSNLYDVFRNIADDEREHVKTMTACRDYSIVDDLARKKLTSKEPTLPPGAASSAPSLVMDKVVPDKVAR